MVEKIRPGHARASVVGAEKPFKADETTFVGVTPNKLRRPRRDTQDGYVFKDPLLKGIIDDVDRKLTEGEDGLIDASVKPEDLNRFDITATEPRSDRQVLSPNEHLDQEGDDGQTVVLDAPSIDAGKATTTPVKVTFKK